ncbi:hypothetical protein MIB92_18455 [Aestuariirhabdus sp. Z084]|uniref:hypothetical protein n=1 Tax=Aestuariirhabdus haliotis TaxID=2918751 RepID=UPI00201B41D8|nr:hypothetical protein [Aestuariirhabdus haliotis]MCL6417648.1 hypothetical protein [Aestuariirhabdus haliotis]MCL6421590.1 hypothetical protein [Aestuariirhabdus haliotis]
MGSSRRDDFTDATKRTMAERVAWRCSYPDCGRNTVGPNSNDPTKRINNGISAHIHAAAPNGPRYNPDMSQEERRAITNGIWMCRDHGNLIDADFTEYSADTLLKWKLAAEKKAAESLKLPFNDGAFDETTLLQIGSENILHARWNSINSKEWSFELVGSEIGNTDSFHEYVMTFNSKPESEKFVVVESQGDARKISGLEISKSRDGNDILKVSTKDKFIPTDPNNVGMTFKLNETGDISIGNGQSSRISGIEAAIQSISTCVGVIKGEIAHAEEIGSLVTDYYNLYSEDLELFSRLLKLEFIRLSLIPVKSSSYNEELRVPLHFVKRFISVNVIDKTLEHSRFSALIELEWGNGTTWKGSIPIFVYQT